MEKIDVDLNSLFNLSYNFENLKLIIENKYVKPIVSPNENYSWSLDYYTCEITVNIDEIT